MTPRTGPEPGFVSLFAFTAESRPRAPESWCSSTRFLPVGVFWTLWTVVELLRLRPSLLRAGERFGQRRDDEIGARFAKLNDGEMSRGNTDRDRTHRARGLDVERGVADDKNTARVDRVADDRAASRDRTPRELRSVVGIRSVSSEAEEAVESGPGKLDVCGCLESPVVIPRRKPSSHS